MAKDCPPPRKATAEQVRSLRERMGRLAASDERYGTLYGLLLSHGGTAVTAQPEEDIEKLVSRGYARTGRGVRMRRGEPSRCHGNAALLWEANPGRAVIVVGWALSEDGIWRQHSWVKDAEDGRIYETTMKRTLYFGFDLTPEEAAEFHRNNAY